MRTYVRSGPNSANEAKNKGATELDKKNKNKNKNKKQQQATSEIYRKVAEIPPPK